MKKIIFALAALLSLAFTSCSKDDDAAATESSKEVSSTVMQFTINAYDATTTANAQSYIDFANVVFLLDDKQVAATPTITINKDGSRTYTITNDKYDATSSTFKVLVSVKKGFDANTLPSVVNTPCSWSYKTSVTTNSTVSKTRGTESKFAGKEMDYDRMKEHPEWASFTKSDFLNLLVEGINNASDLSSQIKNMK